MAIKGITVSGHTYPYPSCGHWDQIEEAYECFALWCGTSILYGLVPRCGDAVGEGWCCTEDKQYVSLAEFDAALADDNTKLLFIAAHGAPHSFTLIQDGEYNSAISYCSSDTDMAEFPTLYLKSIESIMAGRGPIGLAFLMHCSAMDATGPGTLEYVYRKGANTGSCVAGWTYTTDECGFQQFIATEYLFQMIMEKPDMYLKALFDIALNKYCMIPHPTSGIIIPRLKFTGDEHITMNQLLGVYTMSVHTCFDAQDNIVCDWPHMELILDSGEVAREWWNLNYTQRYNIADMVFRNSVNGYFEQIGIGGTDCDKSAMVTRHAYCGDNTSMRICKHGNCYATECCDTLFYTTTPEGTEWTCLGHNGYCLPVYAVSTLCHSMAAIKIGEDPTDIGSWYIYNYSTGDIKPQIWGSQIRMTDPINWMSVSDPKSVCNGTPDGDVVANFIIEYDTGIVRLRRDVALTISTTVPEGIFMDYAITNVGEIVKEHITGTVTVTVPESTANNFWFSPGSSPNPYNSHSFALIISESVIATTNSLCADELITERQGTSYTYTMPEGDVTFTIGDVIAPPTANIVIEEVAFWQIPGWRKIWMRWNGTEFVPEPYTYVRPNLPVTFEFVLRNNGENAETAALENGAVIIDGDEYQTSVPSVIVPGGGGTNTIEVQVPTLGVGDHTIEFVLVVDR